MLDLFAVCAPGLEALLAAELQALGLEGKAVAGGVELPQARLAAAARMNLRLRTASRVLVRLGSLEARGFGELVHKAALLPWEQFARRGGRVALRVTCRKSKLYHSGAVAQRLHEALQQRLGGAVTLVESGADEVEGGSAAEQLFVARFEHDVCTVSADSSGALLHQRGWRGPQAKAPLRETLAAALLLAAGYDGSVPLCDPLCGSGTIAIEAALLAMRRAPGLARGFALESWPAFDAATLKRERDEARAQERPLAVRIEASDQDAGAVAATRDNAARAGVPVSVAQRRVTDLPPDTGAGLLACNLPYGVRVQSDGARLWRELLDSLRRRPAWALAALASAQQPHPSLLRRLLKTQNGGLPVQFLASGTP